MNHQSLSQEFDFITEMKMISRSKKHLECYVIEFAGKYNVRELDTITKGFSGERLSGQASSV